MTNIKQSFLLLLSLLLVSGCSDEEKVKPEPEPTEKTANEWILETMRENYLWDDEIPGDSRLNLSAESDQFFYSLLSDEDGKDTETGHYYYSSINKKKTDTKAYMGDEYTYGFEFQYYYITNLETYALQVLYVLPESPAGKAGLKRGEWITRMNGNPVSSSADVLVNLLYPGSAGNLTLGVAELPDGNNPRSLQVTAAIVKDDPVFAYKTIPYKGKRVGYLAYNHFTAGPEDDNQTFNNSLRKAFVRLKEGNPEEFILDLRYNPGGLLTCAQLLATMLAPESAITSGKEVFCRLINNKDQFSYFYFSQGLMNEGTKGANLNLKKLYVITSSRTASASEAIINGLEPHMEVIIVGEQTEGKNVGSLAYDDDRYEWELHPIVSKLSNKDGFSDYSDGFSPTFPCNESQQNTMFDLGDEQEFILNQVLNYIADGTPISSKSASLRSPGLEYKPLYNSLDRKRINSVILPASYKEP